MVDKIKQSFISRPEIRFWFAIITVIVTGAVAFANLNSQVQALDNESHEKGMAMVEEVERQGHIITDMRETQIKMEKDIEFIKLHTENIPIQ